MNARDLHAFLEAPTRFNDWIAGRIREYGFSPDQDFVTFTEKSVKGRPSREYHLSLDMAKELAMVERNDKGREARRYFIECEKKLHAVRDSLENFSLEHLISSLRRRLWEPSLHAGMLQNLLPAGQYGEPAPNGQQRLGFRRSAWVAAPSRNYVAKELIKQLLFEEFLEETGLSIPH